MVYRLSSLIFVVLTVATAWLGMTAVHELGHAIHACVSGGKLVEVELPPRGLGHTQVWPNPHPRFVAWGGACWGCLSPLLIWISARRWA
ncbi:MAG: M50 family metallopeptidase, partial [Candidatus Saccharimonadales bacterium]